MGNNFYKDFRIATGRIWSPFRAKNSDKLESYEKDYFKKVLSGKVDESVVARIDQNAVYRSLADDPANIYSLLLVAG